MRCLCDVNSLLATMNFGLAFNYIDSGVEMGITTQRLMTSIDLLSCIAGLNQSYSGRREELRWMLLRGRGKFLDECVNTLCLTLITRREVHYLNYAEKAFVKDSSKTSRFPRKSSNSQVDSHFQIPYLIS